MVPASPEEELYFVTRLLELTNTEERSVLRQYFAYKDFEAPRGRGRLLRSGGVFGSVFSGGWNVFMF